MPWNWQQPDWPNFSWSPPRLAKAEERFLMGAGVLIGAVSHLDSEGRDQVTVEAMAEEAHATSEIEGEILSRESVQSSIRRQLGLAHDDRQASPAEQGVAEMMVALYRSTEPPLDHATVCAWHTMLMRGRRDLRDVGRYRTHTEPMQVVSGPGYAPKVHFEAPPSSRVPAEMDAFMDWFNGAAPGGRAPLPALTRAGLAHLYFESIHPFEDGNGRIGRAISEKALAQSLGRPTLTALAATILRRRQAYYARLEASNRHNEVTGWLAWFAGISLEAQQRAHAQVAFLIDKARLLERLHSSLNDRQRKVLLRMLRAGPDGFKGGLSAGNYVAIARTSTATATRDLAELVEMRALHRTGERRYARYHLEIPARPVGPIRIDEAGNVIESNRDQADPA